MILCFTQDDLHIVTSAYAQQKAIFGTAYCYLKDHSFTNCLGKAENLFITAHGNESEIGNAGPQGFAFTPAALATVLKNYVLPAQYTGSIYVSACDTAPNYVKGLLTAMGATYTGRIYGCVGKIELSIQPPANNMWILAKTAAAPRKRTLRTA